MRDMRRALLVTVFLISLVITPISAFAAESTFFGPVVPPECNCPSVISPNTGKEVPSAADWGCVLQTVQNSMNLAVSISVIIVVLAIVYAGLVFMLSATNPENRKKGRQLVTNAFLGMLVVFSAWVFVDFIMKVLYNPDTSVEGVAFGPWNAILSGDGPKCIQVAKTPDALPDVIGQPPPGPSAPGTDSGGGRCEPTTDPDNPCSVEKLSKTCFANRVQDASGICRVESSDGETSAESGSDLLNSGRGPSYSIGLWQINLTVNDINNMGCPTAFTKPCSGKAGTLQGELGWCTSSIKPGKESLYRACVAAAKNVNYNMATACKLYQQPAPNGGFQPWVHTATQVCHVPVR